MKVQESKKYFVLFYMFGFLAGILSANFIAGEYLADLGIFHEFFMEQYMQTPIDNSEYFWYLLRLRITPLVILGLAGCTKFRKAAVLLFLMWTGLWQLCRGDSEESFFASLVFCHSFRSIRQGI